MAVKRGKITQDIRPDQRRHVDDVVPKTFDSRSDFDANLLTVASMLGRSDQHPRLRIAVMRGDRIVIAIKNASGANISDWKFMADDGATILNTLNPNSFLFSGTMVIGGTVSVKVRKNDVTHHFTQRIVVLPRKLWFTLAPEPKLVNNGFDAKLTVPETPEKGGKVGMSEAILEAQWSTAHIDYGPNEGYNFVKEHSMPFKYYWTSSPTVLDSSSPNHPQFAAANCGSFPRDPFGFATADAIRDEVIRHESGSTTSHYIQFTTALSSPTLNPGNILEPWVQRGSETQFKSDVRTGLFSALTKVGKATEVEPCAPPNDGGVRDQFCQFKGNRNLTPYVICVP